MAGLIEMGRGHRREAMQGLRDVANLESQRNRTNEQLKGAKRATEANSMGSGAAMGAHLGGQYLAGKSLSALGGQAATTAATTAAAPAATAAAGTAAGSGAATGAKAGAIGGPMGMALGALAGLAVGYFLS